MELLTAAQMRAIEQAAIDSGEVTGLELMERAGRGVVEAIFEWRPELGASPRKVVVLCGPGNNGGDGFVVARLLHGQGWDVEVYLYGDEAKLPLDAAENCRRWRELGEVAPTHSEVHKFKRRDLKECDLFIDACFGIGQNRQISDELKLYIGKGQAFGWPTSIAIDLPSGMSADSGKVFADSVSNTELTFWADLTVTFHSEKLGHRLAEGLHFCGEVKVVDIGLGAFSKPYALMPATDPEERRKRAVERRKRASMFDDPWDELTFLNKAKHRYPTSSNKFSHGHTLVLSGGVGKGGAARLAARAALRMGAGLVTVGAPPSALIENASQLNAIMLARIENAEGLFEFLQDDRINSVVIGPGIGVSERTREIALVALQSAERSVVLDADALTVFQEDLSTLFNATRGKKAVLTPHMGEFGRLFPDLAENLKAPATKGPVYSKVDAVRDAACRAGCSVLLKGPDTVVADPSGAVSVVSAAYERACPWLATAGAGDVLAGFIGGIMARGLWPTEAAQTGAWLHQECAREFGPGLIAEDLPETLPKVFRNLGL